MGPALEQIGANLSNKMGTAAAIYAMGLSDFVKKAAARGDNMCDANFWPEHFAELIAPCETSLDSMVPSNASCQLASYPNSDGQPPNPGGRQSASHYACRQAIYGQMQGDAAGLVGPGSQACQTQVVSQEITDEIDHCHEVPIVVDGMTGFVTKQCDLPFIFNGNLKPRPEITGLPTFFGPSKNTTFQIPFHLLPISFPVPVIGGVRFTDRGDVVLPLLPTVGNGGTNGVDPGMPKSSVIKPVAIRPTDGVLKQPNKNTGGGGTNGVFSNSGNAPTGHGGTNGVFGNGGNPTNIKNNPMDNAARAATDSAFGGVGGNASGGAFGFGRSPPRSGGVAPKIGSGANPGGGSGGTNKVNSGTGNAPTASGGQSGKVTGGVAPKQSAPAIDYGGCSVNCGRPSGDLNVR